MELQKQCDFHGKNDGGALYSILAETLDIIETNTCNEKNMIKCQVFFWRFLPRSWTGCGIVDCPELVMIDTINGAVQSEINKVTYSGLKSSKISNILLPD